MARSGGKNAETLTRNIMHKIFDNELAKRYNRAKPGTDKTGQKKYLLIDHPTIYTLIKGKVCLIHLSTFVLTFVSSFSSQKF